MSKVQMLRALVKQRLTAAAEDIFGLFERTIAEYEETLCRSKEENERQRRLLDAVFNPQLRLHRADVQQLLVISEEVSPEQQQEWSFSLDQEDPPEPPLIKEEQEEVQTGQEGEPQHIKEEQEEDWTCQEGEQLQAVEEVKVEEEEEEKPQSSQLHEQMETEADGEDCGGPEPDRNSHPGKHLTPDAEDKTEDSSETEVSDGDCEEAREPQSGLNPLKNNEGPVSDGCQTSKKLFSCCECGKIYSQKGSLKVHMRIHKGEKPFSCSVCSKRFIQKVHLTEHMAVHGSPDTHLTPDTEDQAEDRFDGEDNGGYNSCEKRLSCSVCSKQFNKTSNLKTHMRTHTGEKPFICSVCGKRFAQKPHLQKHLRSHTGEKPFSCSVCGKRFAQNGHLQNHFRCHTGEKPFSCSLCDKCFSRYEHLQLHMRTHTGEKPFSCKVCDKRFTWPCQLRTHNCVGNPSGYNSSKRILNCSVCGRPFNKTSNLKRHMSTHLKRWKQKLMERTVEDQNQPGTHIQIGFSDMDRLRTHSLHS